MSKAAAWVQVGTAITLALASCAAGANQFVPPAGYSDDARRPGEPARPGVATPSEPGAPALTRIPDATLSNLFRVDPSYQRASRAHAKVVGAFAIAEPASTHFVGAWALGFLPVLLSFSDGRCFSFSADYEGGTLSNGRLHRTGCEHRTIVEQPPVPPPPGRSLRLIGSSWNYGAWADDRAHITVVTAPYTKTFEPLFTASMATDSIAAMNGVDWPGGNVTLVGRINGQLTVVTLEVSY